MSNKKSILYRNHTRLIFFIIFILLFTFSSMNLLYEVKADKVICHRCGMEWEKDKAIHAIVNNQTWYECCPICTLMDIIQFSDNKTENLMIAKCETTGEEITIHIYEGTVLLSEPKNPVILLGGSCITNLVFKDYETAESYKTNNSLDHPIYYLQDIIDKIIYPRLNIEPSQQNIICHRCVMEWEKDKAIHAIVNNQTWYECCPICALMDIIQFSDNKTENLMIAKCETTGEEITIHIYEGTVLLSEPKNPVILLGGSCVTNKIFQDNITANTYKQDNFIDKPIYSIQNAIDNVVKSKLKKKEFCSFCDSEIQNNWQVILKINDDSSLKYCCYNCSKIAYEDFAENVESILIADYISGNLLDAYYAYYVDGSDVILPNDVDSCIAFESMFDAYKFRGIHGGSVFMGWEENSVLCLNCGMMIKPELSTIFLLNDGSEYAYCPGCSDASKERLSDHISAVYVGDYPTGMLFNGFDSYYVKNYDVDIPGTMGGHRIAFANLDNAEIFVKENGGIVIDWDGNVVYGQNLLLMVFVIVIIIIIIGFATRSIIITYSKHKKNFDEKNKKK